MVIINGFNIPDKYAKRVNSIARCGEKFVYKYKVIFNKFYVCCPYEEFLNEVFCRNENDVLDIIKASFKLTKSQWSEYGGE